MDVNESGIVGPEKLERLGDRGHGAGGGPNQVTKGLEGGAVKLSHRILIEKRKKKEKIENLKIEIKN